MICKKCNVDWAADYDPINPKCPQCGGELLYKRCCGRVEPCENVKKLMGSR